MAAAKWPTRPAKAPSGSSSGASNTMASGRQPVGHGSLGADDQDQHGVVPAGRLGGHGEDGRAGRLGDDDHAEVGEVAEPELDVRRVERKAG